MFSVALWPNDRGNATTQYLCKINAEGFLPFIGVMPSGLGTYAFIDFMLGGRALTHADLSLLDQHIADMSVHLTPAQNTFLDGLNLPSLTATEVNYMDGVTSSVQTQLNAKQPLDATLTNFAALTITANVLPFGNGNDTFSTCAFTSFARTLVASADAATARGVLGVAAGASVPTAVAPIAVTGTLDALTITTTMATNRLLGRTTAGTGVAESIAPTAPLSLNAGALALVATNAARLFGRQSGSAGNAQELTVQLPLGVVGTELTTVIDNPSLLGRGDAGTGAAREMTMLFPLKLGSTTVTTEIAGGTLMGRTTPGNGPMEAITPGDGLTLAAGVLSIDTETIGSKLTTADVFPDHVVSGLTIDATQAPNIYLNAGVAYSGGKRIDWPGGQIAVAFDLDYYIDMLDSGPSSDGVAHGDPAPSPGAALRLVKFVSNGVTFSGIVNYSRDNLAAGIGSIAAITTGQYNTAFGLEALSQVENGQRNTAVGRRAMAFGGPAATANVAVGTSALEAVEGQQNVAIGASAGLDLTSGDENTFVGTLAGGGVETGNGNTVVGAGLGGFSPTMADTLVLGAGDGAHITSAGAVTTFAKIPVVPTYTIATLPSVVPGGLIYVTDAGGGNGALCFGNESPDWIDVTTGSPP